MRVSTVSEATATMNEANTACRFLKLEGFYMRVSTVSGAIVLASYMARPKSNSRLSIMDCGIATNAKAQG